MARYHVYGIGNALVDMEYQVSEEVLSDLGVEKGLMTLIEEKKHHSLAAQLSNHPHERACGGSAANTIIALAQLGGDGFYTCKVANDEAGKFYLEDLKNCGVDSGSLEHTLQAGTTGKCLVMVTPDADRSMNTFLGITERLTTDDIDLAAIADSAYVYLEGYLVTGDGARNAAIAVAKTAKDAGVKTSLTLSDPNMVNFFKDGLLEMAGDNLDLLFCNEAEAQGLAESKDLNTCVESLKNLSRQFAITRGPQGALLFDGEKIIEIAPNKVDVRDTNGAGDMFAGAFLYGLTSGMDFTLAGELASMMSSQLVTEFGPRLTIARARTLHKSFLQK